MKVLNLIKQLLEGKKLNNILKPDKYSENGFIIEALYKILAIDKKITSINIKYDNIYICQLSDILKSEPISDINQIYNENVYNSSGGKSDFTTKYIDCYNFTSCKYYEKFNPGNSDIEKLNNEASNDLKLKPNEYNLSYVCKDKTDVLNHKHQHSNVKQYFNDMLRWLKTIFVEWDVVENLYRDLEALSQRWGIDKKQAVVVWAIWDEEDK